MSEVTDLEKVGLFEDGPYDTLPILERPDIRHVMGRDKDVKDDPLRLGGPFPLVSGHKLKAATNDWTFSPFLSLWEKKEYEDPGAWKRKERNEQKELNLSTKPFKSMIGAKSMNGLGTYNGTFIDDMPAFNTEFKPKESGESAPHNILTNPGKKGTGYGYADVTINPYPRNDSTKADTYFDVAEIKTKYREAHLAAIVGDGPFVPAGHVNEYFDPNPYFNDRYKEEEEYDFTRDKEYGTNGDRGPWIPANTTKIINGNKDVMVPFERFPKSDPDKSDPYQDPLVNTFRKEKPLDSTKATWRPSMGHKTRQVRSTISYNVGLRVNQTNFHRYC